MIVPAKQKYFGAKRFAQGNIKQGETFSIDSGLGGSWTVEYVHHGHSGPVFIRRAKPEWPAETFCFSSDEHAAENVYILVAE